MRKLSTRLSFIASLVPDFSNVIDVGCDHALLDIYLNKYKNCNVLGIDKNITKAISNVKKLNATVKLLCNDGLKNIIINDEIIILTGIGSYEILNILGNNNYSNDFIIQTTTSIELIEKYFLNNNYLTQKYIVYDKKNYAIIYAKKVGPAL